MVSIGLKYCRNMAQFSSPGVERYVYHAGFGPAEARFLIRCSIPMPTRNPQVSPQRRCSRGLSSIAKIFENLSCPTNAVREAESPDDTLLDFLQTTYEAAANFAKWDRNALERRA